MKETDFNLRRRYLLGAGIAAGVLPLQLAAALLPTPAQPAGPFYPVQLPLDDDNDLTRVAGSRQSAAGLITDLQGRLLDSGGGAIPGARIEIWQCDARGRYHHPGDRGGSPRDPNFQGHGQTLTDGEGRYRFRTIRPVPYPGRTPHIHAAVFIREQPVLVTQIYIEGEPGNSGDFLFKQVPAERRHLVSARFTRSDGEDALYLASFDMVLGHTPDQS